jgi:hypothetical protein
VWLPEPHPVVAVCGYYSGEEVKACTEAGIVLLVPKILTSSNRAAARFDKSDLVYDAKRDAFRCPAGEYAIRRFATCANGMTIITYRSPACPRCALRDRCTTGSYRRISGTEHQAVLENLQRRLDRRPMVMQLGRSTGEQLFGVIKAWMGATRLLCRRLSRVRAEERARSGLQPEASDQEHGNRADDPGVARLITLRFVTSRC